MNIETMNIISSDVEINENYFLDIKSIELFAASKLYHVLNLPHFLGFVNHLTKSSKEKTYNKRRILKVQRVK